MLGFSSLPSFTPADCDLLLDIHRVSWSINFLLCWCFFLTVMRSFVSPRFTHQIPHDVSSRTRNFLKSLTDGPFPTSTSLSFTIVLLESGRKKKTLCAQVANLDLKAPCYFVSYTARNKIRCCLTHFMKTHPLLRTLSPLRPSSYLLTPVPGWALAERFTSHFWH